MKQYKLLELCARIEGHPVQQQQLCMECKKNIDWQSLLTQAEKEGMSPLLKKHLEQSQAEYPLYIRRSLNLLAKRHQHKAQVRLTVLQEVLHLCQRNNLTPILIKGAALCCTLYPDAALRPMRDMDILFHPTEVDRAQEIMRQAGFCHSGTPVPSDHFHLPPLTKVVDSVEICFELHRGLYPNCPPYYPQVDFDNLLQTGKEITVGGITATIFNNEEMLHYLYQHAFHAPLPYEPYKLINVADIISFVEKYFYEIDWQSFHKNRQLPILQKSLPLLHHISPWDYNKVSTNFISKRVKRKEMKPAAYQGWPRIRRKEIKSKKIPLWRILKATFLPPFWWVRIYYNVDSFFGYLRAVAYSHPKTIMWWAKLYTSLKSS